MTQPTLQRRNPARPQGYGPTKQGIAAVKELNQNLRYVQGFQATVGAASNIPVPINLNSPGKMLLGITVIPTVETADASNLLIDLTVNSNVLLSKITSSATNPLKTQGMMFFPTPQNLFGNDTITALLTNNSGVSIPCTVNVFYVPRA